MHEVKPIRILLVDEHPVVRAGLEAILERQPHMQVVAQAGTLEQALLACRRCGPDVALMDLALPGLGGVEAIRRLRVEFSAVRVVVLTSCDGDEHIYRALEAGAGAYLFKSMSGDELVAAIRIVHGGGRRIPSAVAARLAERLPSSPLTDREREVMQLVTCGQSNRDIAGLLGVTHGTVKGHMHKIFLKLGAADRVQAVTAALRRGIVRLNGVPEIAARGGGSQLA